jgi:Iap family predicted aminopeptidase
MRALVLLVVAGCGAATAAPAEPACLDPKAIIDALAAKALDGRAPGTDGDRAARAIIVDQLTCRGLTPETQDFDHTANIVATIPGATDDIILLSAHHDHLGKGHLGANDNASGTAGVIELAGELAAGDKPKRTIVVALFGDEEDGMIGSTHFAEHPTIALDKVVEVINLDMIGSYKSEGLVAAMGTFAHLPSRALIDPLVKQARRAGLVVVPGGKARGSDFAPFCDRGIPYVFFWTPDDRCYHETCDTPDRIDTAHMTAIIGFAKQLVDALAGTDTDLAAARTKLGCFGEPHR